MIWLLVTVLVIAVLLAVWRRRPPAEPTVPEDIVVRLHTIRARLLVARHKHETRRRADRVRRELRQELSEHRRGR